MSRARGQRATPTNLKVLDSTTGVKFRDRSRAGLASGKVALEPGGVGYIPPPPKELVVGLPGRRHWRIYWKYGGEWLQMVDYPVVVRLCLLHDVAQKLMDNLDAEGLVIQTERSGRVANRLLNDWSNVIKHIDRLECALGLNPVERSRIRVSPKEKETTLDAWRRERSTTS